MTGTVWAIVVAAGSGTRYGGRKQFARVDGCSAVELAIGSVASAAAGVVVVVPTDLGSAGRLNGENLLSTLGIDSGRWARTGAGLALLAVTGRESRAGSVRAGLEAVPPDCDVVVVHDAARPLASAELCRKVVGAVRAGADGAIPGIGITDTVKRTSGGEVVETLERESLVRVQTPQAFRAGVLRRAHRGEPEATDDAALVEALGGKVVVVVGEETNLKITSPADLDLAEWLHGRLTAGTDPAPTVGTSR